MIRRWLSRLLPPPPAAPADPVVIQTYRELPDGSVLFRTWDVPPGRVRRAEFHLTQLLGAPTMEALYGPDAGKELVAATEHIPNVLLRHEGGDAS